MQHMLDVAMLAVPYTTSSEKIILGQRRVCRAPVACFGSVYVHIAAVLAACIVCVCDRDNQITAMEDLVPILAKPVPV